MARQPHPPSSTGTAAKPKDQKKPSPGSSCAQATEGKPRQKRSSDQPSEGKARPRGGRPGSYNPEIADEIVHRLAEGEALIAICRDAHMPARSTVHGWYIDDVEGFAAKYARARDAGLERMAEETIEIADDSGLDVVMTDDGPRPDGEVINRAKLRVDTRKWLLSKLAPKRYGDRLQVDATVSVEAMDDSELRATVMELATRLGVVLPDWITAIAKQEGTGE